MKHGAPRSPHAPLHIDGPRTVSGFWESVRNVWGQWMSGDYATLVSELPRDCQSPIELTGCRLSWARAKHRSESISYRLDAGRRRVRCTLATLIQPVRRRTGAWRRYTPDRMFLPDDAPVPGHLTPSVVARIASEAGVRRVVLTHIYPAAEDMDLVTEVGRGFEGEIVVAEDGLEFEV